MRVPLTLAAALALTTISASGDQQLRIAVSPLQSYAPTTLNIRARVAPNAENRTLEIIAESEGFYRSSQVPLEGESAPGTILVEFRSVPSGDYLVRGILTDSGGHQRAVAEQQVSVIQ